MTTDVHRPGWVTTQVEARTWPDIQESDYAAVMRAIQSGVWSSVDGPEITQLEQTWVEYTGHTHALAFNGGTSALYAALAACDVGPGDEVITSALSFSGTYLSILMRGAMPVFVDIDPETFNMDPDLVGRAVTSRTKAILVVHLHGISADMVRLIPIAQEHELWLIEDACQAHGSFYRGALAGTLGDIGCWSLNLTKPLPAGEGGLLATSSEELFTRASRVRTYGTDFRATDDLGARTDVAEMVGDVIAGPNAIQAVAAGSAEAGLASIPAIVNANAAGLPIVGVVDIQTTMESQALQRWYVRADSDIKTLTDVEGRDYAVNIWRSSFHYTSLLAMDKAGVDADEVRFRLLSFANQIPALIEGEVDVIGLIQPYQAYLEDEYGDQIRELWNDYDLYGERHVSLIFVNRVWAKHEPEQATCFATGVGEAIAWIEENQDRARRIVSEYTGIPSKSVREYHFTEYGYVRVEDVQAWLSQLLTWGDVTADWLDVTDIATDKFNKAGQ